MREDAGNDALSRSKLGTRPSTSLGEFLLHRIGFGVHRTHHGGHPHGWLDAERGGGGTKEARVAWERRRKCVMDILLRGIPILCLCSMAEAKGLMRSFHMSLCGVLHHHSDFRKGEDPSLAHRRGDPRHGTFGIELHDRRCRDTTLNRRNPLAM